MCAVLCPYWSKSGLFLRRRRIDWVETFNGVLFDEMFLTVAWSLRLVISSCFPFFLVSLQPPQHSIQASRQQGYRRVKRADEAHTLNIY